MVKQFQDDGENRLRKVSAHLLEYLRTTLRLKYRSISALLEDQNDGAKNESDTYDNITLGKHQFDIPHFISFHRI